GRDPHFSFLPSGFSQCLWNRAILRGTLQRLWHRFQRMRQSLSCTLLSGLRFHPCGGKNTAPVALSRHPWYFRVLKILSSHHLRSRIPMAFLVSCSMADYLNISDFLSPVDLSEISADEYREGQVGRMVSIYGGHGDTLVDE